MKCLLVNSKLLFIPIERTIVFTIRTKEQLYVPVVSLSREFISLEEICTKEEINDSYDDIKEIRLDKAIIAYCDQIDKKNM